MGVIVLAVMLIAGIVALMNSIPLSINTIYAYSRHCLGLTPRGNAELTPELVKIVENESPVDLGPVMKVRVSDIQVRSIVGGWPFVVFGLEQDHIRYYIERQGGGKIRGHIPKPDEIGALISEPVARNLNLKLGDPLLKPTEQKAYSPNEVPIVGIIDSPEWIAVVPIEYYRAYHFPPIDLILAFSKVKSEQRKLDVWAEKRLKGINARVYAFHLVEQDTETTFEILYKILNIVIGVLVVVITIMMGMLMNIYQSQRTQEFGLLQALGYTKKRLMRRVLAESLLVVVGGWALGLLAAYGLLSTIRSLIFYPNAFMLDPADISAYAYTIPVPIAILATAAATLAISFRKFDPVSVVERRLA